MISHLRHRVGIANDHIQVRQRAQCCTIQQRASALDAPEHGPLQRRAKYGLGDGVQCGDS